MYTRETFTKKFYPAMVNLTKGTGLFPQVMLAQAILESSGKLGGTYYPGASLLSREANNLFGIKASSGWNGDTFQITTGEYYNGQKANVTGTFRAYDTPEDSLKDYISFLKSNPRYTAAGVFTATTPAQQAERLKAAGYATDPNYSTLLVSVMDSVKKYLPTIAEAGGGLVALVLVAILIYKFA